MPRPTSSSTASATGSRAQRGFTKTGRERFSTRSSWAFDAACNRWRELYRSAVRQRELHHKILGDHSRPEAERNHSRRLRAQAESQIRLLTEAEGIYEGDFYSYRYFAAEGFLPGYNFPRLPLSAYVPARRQRKGRDEFVSRPRFLAISEFGPRALIYHEGARYRVYKVNLDFGSDDIEATHDLVTATMKRCSDVRLRALGAGQQPRRSLRPLRRWRSRPSP